MDWSKSVIEWQEGNTVYLSVVFTWDLPEARQRALKARMLGNTVKAGGPAVKLMPDYLSDVAVCNGEQVPALKRHNPWATFTSRGCIRGCPFCAVRRIEGKLAELVDWPLRPIICDNNLLACSKPHFDRVIDRLKLYDSERTRIEKLNHIALLRGDQPLMYLPMVDFNQGLDARQLTDYHAGRLAELNCMVRLAYDSIDQERAFMFAFTALRAAGIPKSRIRVYVLIGFQDTPEDALYRLRTVAKLGIDPSPMRFQALDSLKKNSFVGPNWTHSELSRYMRYWANLRYMRAVPFEEWDGQKHPQADPAQMTFLEADATRAAKD